MEKIEDDKLTEITGGEVSAWVVVGIGALITFALGFLDGIVNPKGCGVE